MSNAFVEIALPPGEDAAATPVRARRRYAWYVLVLLLLVYVLNFLDRQILSVLAEDIKHDLALTDAQLGFLYGTAFAIFYALFSMPLARLADVWFRGRLIAIGLTLWSVTTAASGLATSYPQLALTRTLVGVGEASASPAAFSMLADHFPPRQRALVASIYTAGAYLGSGLSLPLGGWFATRWDHAFARPPLGLHGWQAAFLAIGVPGLLLALLCGLLREPPRGRFDGVPSAIARPDAWRLFGADLMAILPPLTLLSASRHAGELRVTLSVSAVIAAVAAVLIAVTGDIAQWVVLGLGVHAIHAWTRALRRVDRPTWQLLCGSRTAMLTILGIGLISFVIYAFGFWMTPLAVRRFGVGKEAAGLAIGLPAAILSVVGVVAGGWLSDRWKTRDPRGRVFVVMLGIGLPAPFMAAMCLVPSFTAFRMIAPLVSLLSALWAGSAVALMQDQVLPRMRGTASAAYVLSATILGLALGPYCAGHLADLTGSLPKALLLSLLGAPAALAALAVVARTIGACEATKVARAGSGRAGLTLSLQPRKSTMLIAQISDLHIVEPDRPAYGAIDTLAFLRVAVDRLNALTPQPDLILATGDLTDHGTPAEYRLLRAELDRLSAPVALVAGNHDERDMLRAELAGYGDFPESGFLHYAIETRPVRILVTDSTRANSHAAEFCAARAAWLDERLGEAPDVPTIVAIHHPPFETGIAWMDGEGAGWADRLVEVVARHGQIVRIVCGHLHRTITAEVGGRVVSVAPSVAHQVVLDLVPGVRAEAPPEFEMEPAGFQLHRWDGRRLVTHTAHVDRWPRVAPFSQALFAAMLASRHDGGKMQF